MPLASLLLEPLFAMPFVLLTTKLTLGLFFIGFWIWMLVDVAAKEPDDSNAKVGWILLILFTTWVGAAIYFIIRRPVRLRKYGR